jgi:uncharacterized membrane protein YfcA
MIIDAVPYVTVHWTSWWLVTTAAFGAGFLDAIVGGGGLILVPALFGVFPNATPATLFGTNKCASISGTAWAAVQYSKSIRLEWRTLMPAVLVAFAASVAGAYCITRIPQDGLRMLLPVVLAAVLLYTIFMPTLGGTYVRRFEGSAEARAASAVALPIGFYDGLFGPGTGSFLVFLFCRVLGYDFLRASASSKIVNTSTNCGALIFLIVKGNVWWGYALAMGIANILGSSLGAKMALNNGVKFVRWIFIVVVSALTIKTAYGVFVA